jgi:hypothetical protein
MAIPQGNFLLPSRPVSAMAKIERYAGRIISITIIAFFAATVVASIAAEFRIFLSQ